ncbi:RNA polymerase IV Small Subunit [Gracilaria domingensis]|nr:RNA polymerase IV Small Subunit [Gracilaria domingensis]
MKSMDPRENPKRSPTKTAKSKEAAPKPPPKPKYPPRNDIQPSTLPGGTEDERHKFLKQCVAAHLQSFDFAIEEGLHLITEELDPVVFRGPSDRNGKSQRVSIRLHGLTIQKPRVNLEGSGKSSSRRHILPSECRRTGATYQGDLFACFSISYGKYDKVQIASQRIARIPIMVSSVACHLRGKSRKQLIELGEEEYEAGGSFIVNGAEKVIRLVVVPRSNHPISAVREANERRGAMFTNLSLSFRSMRRDLTTFTVHAHLFRSGAVRIRITISKNEYFIPAGILLRAFLPSETTDKEIYELIVGGDVKNTALCHAAIATIKELSERSVHFRKKEAEPWLSPSVSRNAAIAYLGKSFRTVIGYDDEDTSNFEAGVALLRKYIFVHLSVGPYEPPNESFDRSKADLLVLLIGKLVGTATGDIEADNQDAPSHQSVMTPGQLYLSLLKEKLEGLLRRTAAIVRRESERREEKSKDSPVSGEDLHSLVKESLKKAIHSDMVTKHMLYLLSTGTLLQTSGLDMPQVLGYSVIAERINYLRFIAQFRALHRGTFYAEMRSVSVRKLLPEAWGFICPVHTPDGAPCGILNHLSSTAIVTHGHTARREEIQDLFSDFNITPAPALSAAHMIPPKGTIPVLVDGRVLGFVEEFSAQELTQQLRYSKIRTAVSVLPDRAEIICVPPGDVKTFQPGVYIHTCPGRLMRPVKWLTKSARKNTDVPDDILGLDEWIGTMEQVFLRIRPSVDNQANSVNPITMKGATHAEMSPSSFLSVLASLSPFPEMNQGPRNMFQCQMAKQSMGTPCHAIWNRMDAKVYRLTYPQVPITRTKCMQDPMGADLHPNGINAVIAVISYTGNDMEDALVINKASLERGFAHGTVYVNNRINLDEKGGGKDSIFVRLSEEETETLKTIDQDGLPVVGARVSQGSLLYGVGDVHGSANSSETKWTKYKSVEEGVVDEVIVYDSDMYRYTRGARGPGIREANIRTRTSRRPCVGDKFASRAGQKGTMSASWPCEDMPFSESGITPDILFNPNGFPSRMTIGMMVEVMSGKAGALHGHFNDSSPFQFDEEHRAIDFFAEQLTKAGYEHAGNETLYSGYTGEPFEVNIFTGVVHYQRLRHMVLDKFQVRTTGRVHPLFRQPIKGRKKGGAIRFGEMERDGLLAHGASFLLRDRLAMASDMHIVRVCIVCGSLLGPSRRKSEADIECRICEKEGRESRIEKIAMPYSFKYLTNELAAMNIRTVFSLKEVL